MDSADFLLLKLIIILEIVVIVVLILVVVPVLNLSVNEIDRACFDAPTKSNALAAARSPSLYHLTLAALTFHFGLFFLGTASIDVILSTWLATRRLAAIPAHRTPLIPSEQRLGWFGTPAVGLKEDRVHVCWSRKDACVPARIGVRNAPFRPYPVSADRLAIAKNEAPMTNKLQHSLDEVRDRTTTCGTNIGTIATAVPLAHKTWT
eukprot:CAMPEP_0172669570 /NCGR_PEP_ID=MMETSP1074-20121228/9763_1 /TAXON_ID=2916 /ORGANISM="Ceratium fusus, Strain PA161109" /LENGTH=205 /DNA_ID=CAMNT_0013486367 /DNA_START=64 /DNA_END=682 /DNA_ORIENTATION=+